MPEYSYKCVDNHVTNRIYSVAERKKTLQCPVCGKRAKQMLSRVTFPSPRCTGPIESEALSVHPSEVQNAIAEAKMLGVGVEYAADGTATFRGTREKEKLMKHLGLHYKNKVKGKMV